MELLRSLFVWFFSVLFVILMFPLTFLIWSFNYPFDRECIIVHWWLNFQGIVLTRFNLLWKLKIEGREKAKKDETYVIISNHQSILDILLITCLRLRLRWISKIENFRIPILNWSMKMAKYIPIDRGNPESKAVMMEEAIRSLKQGISIMMFPEGTRSKDCTIQDFKKGAFEMALSTKKPILPVIIDGTGKVLPKKGIIFSGGYLLRVNVLDPVYPESFGITDPEELASKFRKIMETALNEMRREADIQ
jgi:1-acyl-sn-glycerol-3-phosphate acyltransferase